MAEEYRLKKDRSTIIISASSDVGTAMSRRWLARDWNVFGTYRTKSQAVDELRDQGVKLVYCDLADATIAGLGGR